MTVLILCMTNFSLFVRNYRFHKNPRPRQVTALTNQPNRKEGIRVMEDKRVVQFSWVRFVFFPRNTHDFLYFSTEKLKIRMEMRKPGFLLDVPCKG